MNKSQIRPQLRPDLCRQSGSGWI